MLFNTNTAGWGVDAGSVPMIYIIPNVPFSCDPLGSCGRDCLSCCWGPSSPKKDSLNQNKNAQKPTLTKALPTLASADKGISARYTQPYGTQLNFRSTYILIFKHAWNYRRTHELTDGHKLEHKAFQVEVTLRTFI